MPNLFESAWRNFGTVPIAVGVGALGFASLVAMRVMASEDAFLEYSATWGGFSLAAFTSSWIINWKVGQTKVNLKTFGFGIKSSSAMLVLGACLFFFLLPQFGVLAANFALIPLGLYALAGIQLRTLHYSSMRKWHLAAIAPFVDAVIRLFATILALNANESFAVVAITASPLLPFVILLVASKGKTQNSMDFWLGLRMRSASGELAHTFIFAVLGVGFPLLGGLIFSAGISEPYLIDQTLVIRPAGILLLVSLHIPLILATQEQNFARHHIRTLILVSLIATLTAYFLGLAINLVFLGHALEPEAFIPDTFTEVSVGAYAIMMLSASVLRSSSSEHFTMASTVSAIIAFPTIAYAIYFHNLGWATDQVFLFVTTVALPATITGIYTLFQKRK